MNKKGVLFRRPPQWLKNRTSASKPVDRGLEQKPDRT